MNIVLFFCFCFRSALSLVDPASRDTETRGKGPRSREARPQPWVSRSMPPLGVLKNFYPGFPVPGKKTGFGVLAAFQRGSFFPDELF
jgi:hypothetical protein